MHKYCCYILLGLLGACQNPSSQSFESILKGNPSLTGKTKYLTSPMVTAGDRVYMIGHQDGSFPDLGWHIQGEMGGIWDHPIKLMDGFDITLMGVHENKSFILDRATSFTNYPFASMHHFHWEEENLDIERWQFVPDGKEGLIIQLVIKNDENPKELMVGFNGQSDLRPTWLGDRTNMVNGKDMATWNEKKEAIKVKDSLNDWYVVFGADKYPVYHMENKQNQNTSLNSLTYLLELAKGDNILTFYIAGSYTSEEEVTNTFQDLKLNWPKYLQQKKERYQVLAEKSKLTTPDSTINQAFEWLKYNCDWLVRSVPEIGTGIGAGLPDYPWWFGVDSEYALQGYMAVGQTEPVYQTIALLDSVSNALNGNGRIIHEMSTNGAVFNPGNTNETPQFASLLWKIYQWNGDKTFLKKYFPTVEKGLDWLMTERDSNGNLFPDGFGMMEIHGMDSEMIDVASYTQKAFADASQMASELGKKELSKEYSEKATALKQKINEAFWSETFASYADFIGTDEQALKLIEDAMVRADTLHKPWAVEELKQTREFIAKNPSTTPRPFVLHHNWVVNTPMQVGIAPKDKALKALQTAERFVNPFGVFVTGIDRDESAGTDEGSFKGSKVFSYTGAVMTLPTGVQIVAENNYGRPDKALGYLKRMNRSFSYALPGSIYEVSPDYGMMTQAWNIYGMAVPIVEQFFGIQPNAANKKVTIQPQMPTEWNNASLENVPMGDNQVSIFYKRTPKELIIEVQQTQLDWEITLLLEKTEKSQIAASSSEKATIQQEQNRYRIVTHGNLIKITIAYE